MPQTDDEKGLLTSLTYCATKEREAVAAALKLVYRAETTR
jgi:hypothetical protein